MGAMSFGSAFQVMMRLARVALASIVLVGVPLAEAATCAGEEVSSTINASVHSEGAYIAVAGASDVGADHDAQLPKDAEHCIHGHCHHSTPFQDSEQIASAVTEGRANVLLPIFDNALSRVLSGLERPPKA